MLGRYDRAMRARWPVGRLTLLQQAIAAIKRNNGTLFYVPQNALGDGAPNLLSAPEFAGGLTDAPIRGGLITASTMTGYDVAIAFGHDGSTTSYAYKGFFATTSGLAYIISVIVKMDDGLAPTFGNAERGHVSNTFALVANSDTINPSTYTVSLQSDGSYRVSGAITVTSGASYTGVVKYATNNNRTFKVTGYKLELGSTATAYTPQSVLRTRGVFIDSAGVSPVTNVADVLGLMTDRSYGGALGAELVTNGDFSNGTTGWTAGNASLSVVSGELKITAASTAQPAAKQMLGVQIGKTYRLTATLRADALNTVAASARVRVGANPIGGMIHIGPLAVATNGVSVTYSGVFTAVDTVCYALLEVGSTAAYGNAGDAAYFDNISVKEILGAVATQATTANKPTVRMVPKLFGPNLVSNGDGSSLTGWTGSTGYSVASGTFKCNGATAAPILQQNVGVQQGKTYRVTFTQSGRTAGNSYLVLGGTQPAGTQSLIANQTYSFVLTATTTAGTLAFSTPSGTYDGSFDNISVQEVLEWSYAMSFDGSNDSLTTNITTGNEGWVCAGVTFGGVAGANETVFASGASIPTQKGIWLARVGAVSENTIWLATGNGTTRNIAAKSDIALRNISRVIEGGWRASTLFVAVDGVAATAVLSGDLTPPSTARIGADLSGTNPLNGPMTCQVICPILPSAADRALIRKWIGSLQGQTL